MEDMVEGSRTRMKDVGIVEAHVGKIEQWRHIEKGRAGFLHCFLHIFNFVEECNREICRNIDFLDAPRAPRKVRYKASLF